MSTTWKISTSDRDAQGNIKLDDDAPPEQATMPALAAAAPSGRIAAFLPPDPRPSAPTAAPSRPNWRVWAGAALVGLLVAVALIAMLNRGVAAPLAASPTAAAPPSAAPAVAPFGTAIDVALVAYFDPRDPNGATALEHGTRVLPIARIGETWLQLQLADGSAVWVRATALASADLARLPDRAPPPTDVPAAPVYVAPPIAPATPIPCDEATAPYRVARRIERGGIPIGEVRGWSCVSQAAADASAAQQEQQLRGTVEAGR